VPGKGFAGFPLNTADSKLENFFSVGQVQSFRARHPPAVLRWRTTETRRPKVCTRSCRGRAMHYHFFFFILASKCFLCQTSQTALPGIRMPWKSARLHVVHPPPRHFLHPGTKVAFVSLLLSTVFFDGRDGLHSSCRLRQDPFLCGLWSCFVFCSGQCCLSSFS